MAEKDKWADPTMVKALDEHLKASVLILGLSGTLIQIMVLFSQTEEHFMINRLQKSILNAFSLCSIEI